MTPTTIQVNRAASEIMDEYISQQKEEIGKNLTKTDIGTDVIIQSVFPNLDEKRQKKIIAKFPFVARRF